MSEIKHLYEIRPRKDHRGVDLISNALPFGRLWYGEPNDAIAHAKFRSRSHDAVQTHDAVIRVYDAAGQRDRDAQARGRFQKAVSAGNNKPPRGEVTADCEMPLLFLGRGGRL